jgi:hypothetical protein
LEGEHPLLIDCPTLVAMKALLHFKNFEIKATINNEECILILSCVGNHLFSGHFPTIEQIQNWTTGIEQKMAITIVSMPNPA